MKRYIPFNGQDFLIIGLFASVVGAAATVSWQAAVFFSILMGVLLKPLYYKEGVTHMKEEYMDMKIIHEVGINTKEVEIREYDEYGGEVGRYKYKFDQRWLQPFRKIIGYGENS